ncbi:MAG: hypothetical protein AB8G05_14545 [Oligoflexales bacterium]
MKPAYFLSIVLFFSACIEQSPRPNSGLLITKRDDGTISKKIYNLFDDDLPINFPGKSSADIVFYTDSPGTTLGDTSAASKLLSNIREHAVEHGKAVDYSWVIRSEGFKFNAYGLIPPNVPTLIINDWQAIRMPKVVAAISKAKVFISFPTFHYLEPSDVNFLDSFEAEYVRCTEYDFKESEKEKIVRPDLTLFETGLREGRLGIFIESPQFFAFTDTSSISDSDSGLRALLNSTNWNKQNLFFGYFNREANNEQKGSWSNLVNFASLSSLIGIFDSIERGQKLEVNIVIPASEAQFNEIKNLLNSLAQSSHRLADRIKPILADLKLEYYKVPKEKGLSIEETEGPIVRIINPFPLAKENMLSLLQMSHEFSGLTGDQSLSEGLQYGKIPFYQIMHWKTDFHKYFAQYLYSELDGANDLAHFFSEFSNNGPANGDFLIDRAYEIFSKKDQWTEQMQNISEKMYETKNLKDSLAPEILSLLPQ